MSMIAWIVLGLITGIIASKLPSKTSDDPVLDVGLGIVGAIVGGFAFDQLGAASVTGSNFYGVLSAVSGAVLVLTIYHAVIGRLTVV